MGTHLFFPQCHCTFPQIEVIELETTSLCCEATLTERTALARLDLLGPRSHTLRSNPWWSSLSVPPSQNLLKVLYQQGPGRYFLLWHRPCSPGQEALGYCWACRPAPSVLPLCRPLPLFASAGRL